MNFKADVRLVASTGTILPAPAPFLSVVSPILVFAAFPVFLFS